VKPAWGDLLEDLCSAQDEFQLFSKINSYAQSLGFEYCCYGIRMPIPVSNPTVRIFDSYPAGWIQHYEESHFITVDPTVRQMEHSAIPLVWSDQTFADAPRLWDDAREHGLRIGISQPCWVARGIFGLLSLARPADGLSGPELASLVERINWLASVSHTLMSKVLEPKLVTQSGRFCRSKAPG
jgi:LuxR family transcriptional regulator, quorum-sensing system regulator SolR